MRMALIAHDRMKDRMVTLATEFATLLKKHTLLATGTTGGRLQDEVGLDVERLLSGPLGGDLQIGARLSMGEVDAVVFLRDPMSRTSMRWCGRVTCTMCRAPRTWQRRACCWTIWRGAESEAQKRTRSYASPS
jgi:hypothetical protein